MDDVIDSCSYSSVHINGIEFVRSGDETRGIQACIVDVTTCEVTYSQSYDTFEHPSASANLIGTLQALPSGKSLSFNVSQRCC